jgi:signal peptidase I
MSLAADSAVASMDRYSLLRDLQSLLYILVVALFLLTFLVQPFRIPSASMEPTLLIGDFLLVNKQLATGHSGEALAPTGQIHRGEIVVFHYPVNPALHLVKRVIGLPGEHLHLRDGHVFIDGRALVEPYAVYRSAAPDSYRDDFPRMDRADPEVNSRWWIQMHSLVRNGELIVPPDSYFVLGDNRNDSEDSRYWGLVPRSAIVGRPFLVYFSLNTADPDLEAPTPSSGQSSAAALQAGGAVRSHSLADSIASFARWDRTLRILR